MTIRIKLLLGYVLLAVLVVVVGLVGYRATYTVGWNFDQAINRTQPVLQALQEIRFQTVGLMAHSYRIVHFPAGEAAEPRHGLGVARLDGATARYQGLVEAYFPAERDEAAEIVERAAAFRRGVESLLTTSRPDSQAALSALSRLVTRVLEATEEAAATELAEFTAQQSGVDAQVADQEDLIIFVSTIAFLCAVVGGITISGRISRPVIALRDAARNLGNGRLDTRVVVADATEIGELAQAFNSMAEQLSGSMVSREYVEDIIDSMAEGMVVVDRDGRIERANSAFRALLGCVDDYAFAGWPVADYLPRLAPLQGTVDAPAAGLWIETEMHTATGEVRAVALSVAGLRSNTGAGAVVLVQDISERKRDEERLNYLARYDPLTGLPNRTLLLDHLGQALSRLPWKKEHTAILFCDLDRFKIVNDTLGHGVGDVLLQRVAERLLACVRPGDIVARWSGDEFIVLLNDVARFSDIGPLAERVVAVLSQPIQVGPHELYITASVGVGVGPEHADQPDELVKCADMAMNAAKAEGKNRHCFYAKGMAEQSHQRMRTEAALRRALLEGGQLQVHYQAQQRLDGPLIGFEALVRWHHPDLGLISPAQFLPAAAEAGLMAAIDETVMRMACAQARQWRQDGVAGLRIALNVSDHLFRCGDLPKLVHDLLVEYELPPSAIELELTEAVVMSDIESSIATMHRIRELGIGMSIDDFGTGYSSLSHLKRCPIQMLKIDRSFVSDVMTDPNDAAITEAITALAHKMGIEVIAEGVETAAQLEALRRYGCDAMQGYWLSKPIPASMLPDFLARFGHPRASAVAALKAPEAVARSPA